MCEKAAKYNGEVGNAANFIDKKTWLRHFKASSGIKKFDKPSKFSFKSYVVKKRREIKNSTMFGISYSVY